MNRVTKISAWLAIGLFIAAAQFRHVPGWFVDKVDETQPVLRREFALIDLLELRIVPEVAFLFLQKPRAVEQIPEHLVVGKGNAPPIRAMMRVYPHKQNARAIE